MRRRCPISAEAARKTASVVLGVALFALCGCGGKLGEPAALKARTLYLSTLRIRGFDPAKVGDVSSAQALQRIYEGLVEIAYLDRPYRVEPLLAEAMPDVSDDGLTYTFHLRRGIFFQDDPCFVQTQGRGREVTADDFIYSVERIADLKNASVGWWAFQGRILGLDQFRAVSAGEEPTDYGRRVEGLQALDRYTLRITLTQPYPQLLWVLALHYGSVVSREAVEFYGDRFGSHPVGTGPYVLKSWTRNYRIEFERNPKWRDTGRVDPYPDHGEEGDAKVGFLADAGRPVPFIDRIVTYVVADAATQWLMFLTGQLDEADLSRDNWNVVIGPDGGLLPELYDKNLRLAVAPQLRITYIGFNMDDPVVGRNKALRQAMTCAFNSEEWIKLNHGSVRRPNGPIPSMLPGCEPDYVPFPFDLKRAQALLAAAGYPEGKDPATGRRLELTLELGRADDLELRQSAELFAAFMERIGVLVKLSYNNGPAYYEKLERRQAQMFYLSWIGDYPDAENFLQCFYGPNSSPGPNRANYVNPEFDRLYDRIRTMRDAPERTELYQQMARIVIEDCPWIFAAEPRIYSLYQARMKNRKPHMFSYGMEKYYRLEARTDSR